jgi:transcription antitermination protein NusB
MSDPSPAQDKARLAAMQRKTAARLAAVQALYSIDLTEKEHNHAALALEFASLVEEAEREYSEDVQEESAFARPDEKMLLRLINAVSENLQEIDTLITGHLAAGWTMERLKNIMRAIIRAGVAELLTFPDVPVKVIINEYATVTRAFFSISEIGFVNGILERIALKVRPEEMKVVKKV